MVAWVFAAQNIACVSDMLLNSFVKGDRSLYTYVYSITRYRTPAKEKEAALFI